MVNRDVEFTKLERSVMSLDDLSRMVLDMIALYGRQAVVRLEVSKGNVVSLDLSDKEKETRSRPDVGETVKPQRAKELREVSAKVDKEPSPLPIVSEKK